MTASDILLEMDFPFMNDKPLWDFLGNLEINCVSALRDAEVHNALMFSNSGLQDFINYYSCVILVKSNHQSVRTDKCGNVLVFTPDCKFEFAKLVNEHGLELGRIFDRPKNLYTDRNIRNAIVGIENIYIAESAIVGNEDFCPVRNSKGETIMFPQLGYVKLGDRVQIFPNSIVCRGALWSTEIGDDTKVDALCQVGHNSVIGKDCMICVGTHIGGSVTIGDNVFIGMGSNIRNGVKIGNNVTIGQGSNVVSDIPDNSVVMGNPAKVVNYNDKNFNCTEVAKR